MIAAFVWMIFMVILVQLVYITSEIRIYRKGGDVFQWTVKLAKWLDRNSK